MTNNIYLRENPNIASCHERYLTELQKTLCCHREELCDLLSKFSPVRRIMPVDDYMDNEGGHIYVFSLYSSAEQSIGQVGHIRIKVVSRTVTYAYLSISQPDINRNINLPYPVPVDMVWSELSSTWKTIVSTSGENDMENCNDRSSD